MTSSQNSHEATIEKLVYGGDGLARIATPQTAEVKPGGRGKTTLIPEVLPGERVRFEIEEESRTLARGRVVEILEPSPLRTTPGCEYFGRCGGCQWQHMDAATQLAQKEQILRETLRRTGHIEWEGPVTLHASPAWGYRNRVRLRFLRNERGPGPLVGYYYRNSHRLLPVEHCPIASPRLNGAIAALAQLPQPPATAREVELVADAADDQVMALFLFEQVTHREREYAAKAAEKLSGCSTAAVASGPEGEPQTVTGDGFLPYQVGDFHYRVSAGAFFQVNRFLVQEMVETVVGEAKGQSAMDLFSGVGLFTLPLAQKFLRVHSVESHPVAAADLRHNTLSFETVKVQARPVTEWAQRRGATPSPDLVVVDPPRTGLGRALTDWLAELRAARIHSVSCDPATLARDLEQLVKAGYEIEAIHLFDLFPQTYHIETVVLLRRGA